jgi:serine/threonine-protein kinase PknK
MGAVQSLPARSEPFIGLDGFTDVEAVASGATSQVFRACQPTMNRLVAIKVLGLTVHDARVRARFERELATTGHLSRHPVLVTIHSHGISATGHPYLVMPWYERGSVADELERRGTLTVPEVLRIGVKIGAALDHVHGQGVLHRDVKPSNVLLSDLGESVLADFGGAVQLDRMSTATTTYTPNHAAPELFCGGTASPGSDVWSLTSTLYTALTGKPPFALVAGAGGLVEELARLVQAPMPEPSRDDVPGELVELLRAGLAKQADDRPSALELASELQRIQAGLGMPMTEIPGSIPWPTRDGTPARPTAPATPLATPAAESAANSSANAVNCAADASANSAANSSIPAFGPSIGTDETGTQALPVAAGPVPALSPLQSAADRSGEVTVLRNPVPSTADRSRLTALARIGAGALAGTAAGGLVLAGVLSMVGPDSAAATTEPRTPVNAGTPSPSPAAPEPGGDPSQPAEPQARSRVLPAGELAVTRRSATTIALSWQDTNKGRFRYLVIGTPVDGGNFTQRAETKSSHTVRSLQPGTTYCFRIATGSAEGEDSVGV